MRYTDPILQIHGSRIDTLAKKSFTESNRTSVTDVYAIMAQHT